MSKGGVKSILASLIVCSVAFCASAGLDPYLTLNSPVRTNDQFQFTLSGEYGVSYVIEGSTDLQTWMPVLTNGDAAASRTLTTSASNDFTFYRARRERLPLFSGAITVRTNVNFNGNTSSVDSFDSSDIVNFPGGLWNATNRRAHGDVASGHGLNLGNAAIMGKLLTTTITNVFLGPSGSVGDVAWVTGGAKGIEPGFYINDFRFCLPDVQVPYSTGLTPTGSGTNTYVLSSGQYLISGDMVISSGHNILVQPASAVTLFVTGNMQMSASSAINISSTSRLMLFVGGGSASLSGINNAGNASSFQYYGLPSNTNITSASSSQVVGLIYAPEANATFNGGGASPADFVGACVFNNLSVSGHINFHFDENLIAAGPFR
jgi:hypothetical protein